MKIEHVELVRFQLPLVRPFRTSFGTQNHRDVILVHVITDAAEGWGECVVGVDPFYNEEYTDAAYEVLVRWLIPMVFAHGPLTAEEFASVVSNVVGNKGAKAAFEMALLDSQLRAHGVSLTSYLGGTRATVPVGVSIGITPTVDELVAVSQGYVADGYSRLKLKIEPGFDVDPVRRVREAVGDSVMLQVDANAAYSDADIDHCMLDWPDASQTSPTRMSGTSSRSSPSSPSTTSVCGPPAGRAGKRSRKRASSPETPSAWLVPRRALMRSRG